MKIGTYVSAYYHIPKPKLPHMGLGRYVELAPRTLRMLGGKKLYFYYEEDFVREIVSRISAEYDIDIQPIYLPRQLLPMKPIAERIAQNAKLPDEATCRRWGKKEKGVAHIENLCDGDDRQPFSGNLSIWLSKISLVNEVLNLLDPSSNRGLAWVDFGISKVNYRRSNWDFSKAHLSEGKINHYGSNMRYLGKRLPLSAGFLAADNESWRKIESLFKDEAVLASNEPYAHDEETILKRIHHRVPAFFQVIGRPEEGRVGKLAYVIRRATS